MSLLGDLGRREETRGISNDESFLRAAIAAAQSNEAAQIRQWIRRIGRRT